MPTIQVDHHGRELYYEDSGPPAGSPDDYVTVVLLHGLVFHGAIFRPMLRYASAHRLRLVLVNQRDYPGSSGFTAEELLHLNSADSEAQIAVLKGLGLDLAVFLTRFILSHDIHKPGLHGSRRTGGLALVAWSLGAMTLHSFLAYGHESPTDIRRVIEQYLRVVISYDAAGTAYGVTVPPELYSPVRDPALSPERKAEEFVRWISCYCDPIDDLNSVSAPLLAMREKHRDTSDTSYHRLCSADIATLMHFEAFTKYQFILNVKDALQELTTLALYETSDAWNDTKLVIAWCDRSPWGTVWGAKQVADRLASSAERMREIRVVKLPDANHFLHWEDPERMVRVISELIG